MTTVDREGATEITGLESVAVEAAVAVPSAIVARRLARKGYEKITGNPAPDNPERSNRVPAVEAILWLAAVAAMVAAARAIAWRAVVRARQNTGSS